MEPSRFQASSRTNCATVQRKNAEHQVAQNLGVATHTYLTTTKVVPVSSTGQALETTIDALHG